MRHLLGSEGLKGFDCNFVVTPTRAASIAFNGFKFAVRYIPRETAHPNDLSPAEIKTLHNAGLAVMAVQHVESEQSWVPSKAKGELYGKTAANAVVALGLQNTTVWLDLEGVAPGTPAADVIAYCHAWFDAVAAAGAQPGLYVGWHSGLTPEQLYDLPFPRYWGAYNLNADEEPATRGLCMKQKPSVDATVDLDVMHVDHLGGLPLVLAPDDWSR